MNPLKYLWVGPLILMALLLIAWLIAVFSGIEC